MEGSKAGYNGVHDMVAQRRLERAWYAGGVLFIAVLALFKYVQWSYSHPAADPNAPEKIEAYEAR